MKPFAKHLTRTKPMWLYIENGKVKGPVSQEKMSRLIEEGRVSRSSEIAKQQTDDWYAIGETGFEKEISLSESQPVPRQARPLLIGGVAVGCIGRLECVMGLCSFGCRPELWQLGAEP